MIISAIFVPTLQLLKTGYDFNGLAYYCFGMKEFKYENISRFKRKMSYFDTKIYQFYRSLRRVISRFTCYPVRKPRCLPRVKLSFYRGLQRGRR